MCIAGVTQDCGVSGPSPMEGFAYWSLYKSKKPIIYPGSKVWMDFSESEISPPHIEDQTFDPMSVEQRRLQSAAALRNPASQNQLWLCSGRIRWESEGATVVQPGTDTRSLGTIKNVDVKNITAERRYDRPTVRMDLRMSPANCMSDSRSTTLHFAGCSASSRSAYIGTTMPLRCCSSGSGTRTASICASDWRDRRRSGTTRRRAGYR